MQYHGAQRLAVRLVAVGRGTGVPGLPPGDDWTAWDAEEMRAAVDYRRIPDFPVTALTPTGVMAIRCKQFHLPDL